MRAILFLSYLLNRLTGTAVPAEGETFSFVFHVSTDMTVVMQMAFFLRLFFAKRQKRTTVLCLAKLFRLFFVLR